MAEKASSPMTPLRLRRNKQLECDDNDSIACVYDNYLYYDYEYR